MNIKKYKTKLEYYIYKNMRSSMYPKMLEILFYKHCKYKLNLKDPKTFNEKIQWLKLYDSTKEKTELSDKFLVRDWIKSKIGEQYLVGLIGVWTSFENIDFSLLPNKFVIKTNHGSGYVFIVENKLEVDYLELRKIIKEWMKENFAFKYGFELQYKEIVPKIIIEEYLESINNNLFDYKFHCFNGKVQFIQVIGNRDVIKHTAKEIFFDTRWKPLDCTYTYPRYELSSQVERPKLLEKMVEISNCLSEDFKYVRVDLYCLDGKEIKFGEMTFTPASGFDSWEPNYFDRKWGDLIDL